eukprot:1034008-Amphidinium_carterae.4
MSLTSRGYRDSQSTCAALSTWGKPISASGTKKDAPERKEIEEILKNDLKLEYTTIQKILKEIGPRKSGLSDDEIWEHYYKVFQRLDAVKKELIRKPEKVERDVQGIKEAVAAGDFAVMQRGLPQVDEDFRES